MPEDEELAGIFLNPPDEQMRALCWMIEKLLANRIGFRLQPKPDGQYILSVYEAADSKRVSAWMEEWVRIHNPPPPTTGN